ncbi:hypothetical protein Bca4012_092535 [Brassica carinata]
MELNRTVQKPQLKSVVETPSAKTKEKRNEGLERCLESFKARIHQIITNPRPSSVLGEDQEAKDIEPELSTVYVRAESKYDLGPIFVEEEDPFDYPHQGPPLVTRRHLDDDLGPIFDEVDDHLDDDLGPIFVEEDDHLDDDSDVVDSGPEADHEKDMTTAYASGDILGSLSSAKLVQPFVCKEYDPVEQLSLKRVYNTSSLSLE